MATITGTAGSDIMYRSGDGIAVPAGWAELLGVAGNDTLPAGAGQIPCQAGRAMTRQAGGRATISCLVRQRAIASCAHPPILAAPAISWALRPR